MDGRPRWLRSDQSPKPHCRAKSRSVGFTELFDDAVAGDLDGAVVAGAVAKADEVLAELGTFRRLPEAEGPRDVEVRAGGGSGGGES